VAGGGPNVLAADARHPVGGFAELIAQKQGRYGKAEEAAAAAAFFASDESSWCTGTSLVLDGGFVSSLF
jgi:NAD(P)-dependent dehydrogenase (short-subunit alcohol dehydrogenase family)